LQNEKTILSVDCTACRAGLSHFRTVRPNRAADYRGPPFWTL